MIEDRKLLINLIKVSLLWAIVQFNFYMKNFLMKYLPGSIWFNGVVSSTSELFALALAFFLHTKIKDVRRLMTLFTIATTLGSITLLIDVQDSDFYTSRVVPGGLLFASFGFVGCIFTLWVSNADLFPTVFATTTLGYCNMVARFCTIFAPMVAELDSPIPQRTMFVLSFIATILTLFIDEKTKAFY